MCSMSVLCPLCAQTSFATIDELRVSLIKAANGPLACPICHEAFLGLDKLTIHLFSHTSLMTITTITTTTPKAASATTMETTTAIATAAAQVNSENSTLPPSVVNSGMQMPSREQNTNQLEQVKREQVHEMSEEHNSSFLQPQQVDVAASGALTKCDICEFRNEEIREEHLLHQSLPAFNGATSDCSDFKCHLCAKSFKMEASLRIHLHVMHPSLRFVLPHAHNSPKMTISERIRHRETNSKVNLTNNKIQQQQQVALAIDSPQTLPNNSFAIGTLTLLPTAATSNASSASVLNINANGELTQATTSHSGAALNSNVLLVFNTTAANSHNNNAATSLPLDNHCPANAATTTTADNPKIWECDVCAKSFTTKYFLKKHKRLHTGEMPYTCEICSRQFTFQQSYHKHLLYHSDEKPHVCATCGRSFKELSTLHNHERIHSGEKPFKCEVCGKCFRQRVSFLVHTRIHTGVLPYKCDICQKSFRYKVSQRTHKCLAPKTTEDDCEVDQISENFIRAFLESTTAQMMNDNNNNNSDSQHNSPASAEIAAITGDSTDHNGAKNISEDEAMLSQTIDDIVVESCNKMGIGGSRVIEAASLQLSPSHLNLNNFMAQEFTGDGSNSPSQKLQNMRLYSPQLESDMLRWMDDNGGQ